jgi:hypothetical protein
LQTAAPKLQSSLSIETKAFEDRKGIKFHIFFPQKLFIFYVFLILLTPTIKKLKATPKLFILRLIDKLYELLVIYLNKTIYTTGNQEVTPPSA